MTEQTKHSDAKRYGLDLHLALLLCFSALLCGVLSGCSAGGTYRHYFRVLPHEFNTQQDDQLTLRSRTYALTGSILADTVFLHMEENYASILTVPLVFASGPAAMTIGMFGYSPTDKGVNHPYSDSPLWFRMEVCWGDSTLEAPPDFSIEADSIFLEYFDEHRTRPFAWTDQQVYTNGGEKHIRLGPFPLDPVKVKDIIDARKVRELPRYVLTFDALIKDKSGNLIRRQRIESNLNFARKLMPLNDSTKLILDE